MSADDPREDQAYNRSDPQMPFCPRPDEGARPFSREDIDALMRQRSEPDDCELTELEITRGIARRLRAELIYAMPSTAQMYEERDVPTSQNLPMFMEFVFELLTGTKDPGME